MKPILYLTALLLASHLGAQTLSPQVINAAGDSRQGGGVLLTNNIGEPFTESLEQGNMLITQGFLQPEINDGITIAYNGLSCQSRNDGRISVAFSTLNRRHTEKYIWSGGACPGGNCGNTVENLAPGDYYVTVISTYTAGNGNVKSDTLRRGPVTIVNSGEGCRIKIFSGVTPNGDGLNDIWLIENITEFPNNQVSIYNRWGALVYQEKGYDNESRYWPRNELVNKLVSSTYFYVIDLGDGSKALKGWVELIKN